MATTHTKVDIDFEQRLARARSSAAPHRIYIRLLIRLINVFRNPFQLAGLFLLTGVTLLIIDYEMTKGRSINYRDHVVNAFEKPLHSPQAPRPRSDESVRPRPQRVFGSDSFFPVCSQCNPGAAFRGPRRRSDSSCTDTAPPATRAGAPEAAGTAETIGPRTTRHPSGPGAPASHFEPRELTPPSRMGGSEAPKPPSQLREINELAETVRKLAEDLEDIAASAAAPRVLHPSYWPSPRAQAASSSSHRRTHRLRTTPT